PMPLIQLATAAQEGWLPDRSVAITFDDGYLDNLLVASPILLERGIPATFFLTSDGLRGVRRFWWDALAWIFFASATLPSRLTIEDGGEALSLPTTTREERERAHELLYHRIRAAGPEVRERLMRSLTESAAVSFPEELPRPMNRHELEALARHPSHSIGGHGTHHLSFSAQPDEVVRRDVSENRTLLEVATGRTVSAFAYPFGDHDDRSVEIIEAIGYRAAVTCVRGIVRPGIDVLRLPRVEIGAANAISFEDDLRTLFDEAMQIGRDPNERP
ncbi:MAG: polysaccharide deacetylase family protein, partial [Candidatus Binatia bacterium]